MKVREQRRGGYRYDSVKKLVCLYLLRCSSDALATERPLGMSSSSVVVEGGGRVILRLARRTDVSSIQRCNLATLPENYSSDFYVQHLRQWPNLALVAEYDNGNQTTKKRYTRYLFGGYDAMMARDNSEIVGYVLGKVQPSNNNNNTNIPRSTVSDNNEQPLRQQHGVTTLTTPPYRESLLLGHVTSLAVVSDHRRNGLAAQLMTRLHHNMRSCYDADAVGLHVRVSNTAAYRLYCDHLGYRVMDVIQNYYQDGEDAYFMRNEFPHRDEEKDVILVDEPNERNDRVPKKNVRTTLISNP